MQLQDRCAVVTGAARGIGRAIALALARAGADVVVNSSASRNAAEETARDICRLGRRAIVCQADVSILEDVRRMVGETLEALGKIDILVNNAGIFINSPIEHVSEEDWDRVMDVNLKGVFLCCREAGRHLIERGREGAIVNVASISARFPEVNGGAYTPSKAGVIGLTKLLAVEWAKYNIRVNAVSPGPVLTPLQQAAYPSTALLAARNRAIPMKRHGTPEEIAEAVVFLASDRSSYMTGEEITVDGGSQVSMFALVNHMAGSP
jgi:NAD(P)-dependent dehydrogenase (short-subunit alcohol dehydrogenase family)